MTEHRFTDRAEIGGMRRTNDGYLVGEVRCARTGCQTYLGSELGLTDADRVTVYRPESAVFSRDSLATFAGKPVTVNHPPENVTADNWKEFAVGDVGEDIARDGEFVRVPIKLMDAAAIRLVEDGKREISMGYMTPIRMEDGVAPDGTKYQAVQTGPIRINHLALVDRARGGDKLRVGDGAKTWGAAACPLTHPSGKKETVMSDALKTVVLGDKAARVAVEDAQIIEQFKADHAKAVADAEARHEKAIADKDAEIAKKDAEIDRLKKDQLSDADLDKRVRDRADLIGKASAITRDADIKGLSDADIRKAVVKAVLGDAAIADKSDAYIEARFDVLAEDAIKGDAFADTVKSGVHSDADFTVADKAYAENVTDLSTAWMGGASKQKEA